MAVPDIKAIIFDCFGVLYLDNKTSLLNVVAPENALDLQDVFTRNNYGYTTKDEYLSAVSDLTHLSVKEVEEYIASEHALNKELTDLITHTLKRNYKVGLLSNIGRDWINDFFSKHELHNLFDQVVLSGEEGLAKPHPAIFTLMASRLNLQPSQCVMIDDIEANCEGAEMAGMYAIHYTSNAQLLDALTDLSVDL